LDKHWSSREDATRKSIKGQHCLLAKKITILCSSQHMYIPGLVSLLDVVNADQLAEHPELAKLWLPSDLPLESHDRSCIPDLTLTEYHMRHA
jgi:hypothetical protein